MTPRSEEFAAEARERLAAARDSLDHNHYSAAVGLAYYAMLYATRAALSERDLHAKTHTGTWSLFSKEFVKGGSFDRALASKAHDVERLRYGADYDAADISREQADTALENAQRFVEAVLHAID